MEMKEGTLYFNKCLKYERQDRGSFDWLCIAAEWTALDNPPLAPTLLSYLMNP